MLADVTNDVGQIHCLYTSLKIGDEFYEQSEYSVFIIGFTQTLRAGGRCQAQPDNVHQLHVYQPSTYEKPEAASVVLGS
jgi:hypothetical protein